MAGSPFSNVTAGNHLSLLDWLRNPDFDLLLLLAGLLLVYVECNLPGKVVPGALGLLAMMLELYGLGRLQLAGYALALIAAGLAALALELRTRERTRTAGLFAAVGGTMLILGLRRLVITPQVHLATAIVTGAVFSLVTPLLARIALQARRNKSLRRLPSKPGVQSKLK